jgi:hypothetical protein
LKVFRSPRRPFNRGYAPTIAAVFFFLLFFRLMTMAQGDSLLKLNISGMPQGDSLLPLSGADQKDSISKNTGMVSDSLSKKGDAAQGDSLSNNTKAQNDSLSKKSGIQTEGLTNIVSTQKNIRAYGWGEYKVGGRCLCCDNLLDGDCIIIHTTNRTDKIRIKQIVDGKTEADTNDKASYFGDVEERERPEPVNLLMAEISLKKMADIYKVIVYTMIDKGKKRSFLSNCELGYYDQFDRLQWAGKAENKGNDDHIAFEMEKPVFTKNILLKVKGGKNRITEVAIFGRNDKK